MKSYKYLLATAVLASLGMNSMAQATYTDKDGNEYQFKKHFYLDIQGGGQYTLGEAKFKDLLSPNIQGAIGYQFSPVFGLRAQMNGLWSKGGWAGFRSKVGEKPYNAKYKFKYIAPGVDFMFNLSNLFCGWNPNRVFNISAFAGGGINWAGGNQEINDIAATLENLNDYNLEYLWQGKKVRPYGRAGIDLEFKVSKAVSIMLEGNANMISDKYNSKKADNPDWYFNALAGVRINLGKSYTKKAKPVEEPAPAPAPKQEYVAPKPEPKPAPVEKEGIAERKTGHPEDAPPPIKIIDCRIINLPYYLAIMIVTRFSAFSAKGCTRAPLDSSVMRSEGILYFFVSIQPQLLLAWQRCGR